MADGRTLMFSSRWARKLSFVDLDSRKLVRQVPLERLMVETDAPYLLPRDLNPRPAHRRNEPKYLPHVVKAIAACRGEPYEAVAAATTRNALEFFGFGRD